jgi:small subunit ribosomal protein S16
MVVVRLSRKGAKKRPFYHIVVTDRDNARDGRFLEEIGLYDPSRPAAETRVDEARLQYWVGVGAQLSPRVAKVVKEHKQATATP